MRRAWLLAAQEARWSLSSIIFFNKHRHLNHPVHTLRYLSFANKHLSGSQIV